jgi:hypothetical protein
MGQSFIAAGGIIVVALALLLLTGWRAGRKRRKCPACDANSMRIVGLNQTKTSIDGRRVLDPWSLYVCDACGARFKDHLGSYSVAIEAEWASQTAAARTPTFWHRPW